MKGRTVEAFIYCADIYCEECGAKIRAELDKAGKTPADVQNESSFDSDEYPKGPFDDAGGATDCPQHCAECKCYLYAPLTSEGQCYAADALWEYVISKRGDRKVLDQWAEDLADYSLEEPNDTKLEAYYLFRDEQRRDNA